MSVDKGKRLYSGRIGQGVSMTRYSGNLDAWIKGNGLFYTTNRLIRSNDLTGHAWEVQVSIYGPYTIATPNIA